MRLIRLLAASAIPILVLAGCGDDSDGGDASTSIEATGLEFEYEPATWTVPGGEEITLEFTNDGSVEHEWALLKLGEDIESEDEFTEDKVLFEVEAIEPEASVTETFTVDEPGTYQVICAIEGHLNAGMEGTLTVE